MTDLWEHTEQQPGTQGRPRDLEAEYVVMAAIMERPEFVDELTDRGFDPADFSDERHAWVWRAVEELRAEITKGPISWIAVDSRLKKWRAEGTLKGVPLDTSRLADIFHQGSILSPSADWYAEKVTRTAEANRTIDLGIRAQQAGFSADFDRDVTIAALQAELDGVVRDETAGKPTMVGELMPEAMERAVTPRTFEDRVPTGLTDLSRLTGGWAPGQLIVVGARPGVGKTTLGLGFARAAALGHGMPTLFTSLEMSKEEISNSILAAESTTALHRIKEGACTEDDVRRMSLARERIDAAPLRIDDTPHVSLAHLRHQVRTLQRAEGLRLVVVDYMQLMQAPRAESRQVAVAALSRGLKLMAKEFGIPVIVMSQLNRASEQRADKKPTAADLRESGAVEQDADIVILVHRPDMYEPDSPRAGEVDLIVDKHRGGHRTTITTAAQLHYARFFDMAGA
ncbi:replicative DNA helicase [Streptomyces fenghuangensis]